MQTTQLIKRSLVYYWQTNLVVVLGVAIAVSVLAGALLIGEFVEVCAIFLQNDSVRPTM